MSEHTHHLTACFSYPESGYVSILKITTILQQQTRSCRVELLVLLESCSEGTWPKVHLSEGVLLRHWWCHMHAELVSAIEFLVITQSIQSNAHSEHELRHVLCP